MVRKKNIKKSPVAKSVHRTPRRFPLSNAVKSHIAKLEKLEPLSASPSKSNGSLMLWSMIDRNLTIEYAKTFLSVVIFACSLIVAIQQIKH